MQPASPVHSFLAAYKVTVLAKDLEGFCSLFSEQVVIFDAWGGPWSSGGLALLRAGTKEWFDSLIDQRVRVDDYEVEASESGDAAFGHGIVRFTALATRGEPLRWLENRFTVCLRREKSGWKVQHFHTSAPADFESKTVQLRRAPESA